MHHLTRLLLASCCVLSPLALSAQSVWTGGSPLTPNWQDAENWTGDARNGAINAQNHLQFGQSARYLTNPDIDPFYFSTITFTKEAEQGYILDGTDETILRMSSTPSNTYIYNNSQYLVTIENDIALYSARDASGYTTRLGNIVAQYGDILWSGNSVNQDAVTLRKGGRKTLTLTGDHSGYLDENENLQGGIEVLELHGGILRLDVNAGFKIRNDVGIEFQGITGHMSGASLAGSGSTLHVVGKADPMEATVLELGYFAILYNSGTDPDRYLTHRIIVDSNGGAGTTLKFDSLTPLYIPAYSATALYTLNVVLDANSKLEMPLPMSGSHPTSRNVTVTTPGGLTGSITGLAAISGDEVIRNTTFTALPSLVNQNVNGTTAYRLVGDATFSRTNANNNTNFSSLTLSANTIGQGGSFNLDESPLYTVFGAEAILMEEGVGDYHIGVRLTKGSRIIHQYSQHGTLYFNAGVDTGFAKTGPGEMVISQTAVNEGTGSISVQEGRLVINSDYATLGNSGQTQESRRTGLFVTGTATGGGTLAGAGTIGAGTYNANFWARIHIQRGGTLDGTAQYLDASNTKKALTIRGDIIFYDEEAIYKVDLRADNGTPLHVISNANNPSTTLVTLNGDLQLDLQYAPQLNDIITLLTWQTGYNKSGQFVTINGEDFSNGNEFSLEYNSLQYDFALIYGANSVYLNVIGAPIPEPATVALLAGVALSGLVWLRRRRG